ncbi:MAG: ABC transporter permease [Oscillospiraceae bacterium]
MKKRKLFRSEGSQTFLWALSAYAIFLIVWQLAVTFTDLRLTFSTPAEVIVRFVRSFYVPIGKQVLPVHVLISFSRVMVGYLVGSVIGVLLGLIMGYSKVGKAIINPIFELFRPIPTIAWIPLAIMWFGVGELPKYFITFMSTFFTVTINTYAGTRSVDPVLLGAAKMLGANKRQMFLKVIFPSCVPHIFAGLQVSLSTSWMSVMAAEMVSSVAGVGWVIIMGQYNADTTQILVGMFAIGITGLLLSTLMEFVERRLCAWNIRGK